ncbi:hypothetical protein [Plantactinospora sp. CA-290183]
MRSSRTTSPCWSAGILASASAAAVRRCSSRCLPTVAKQVAQIRSGATG